MASVGFSHHPPQPEPQPRAWKPRESQALCWRASSRPDAGSQGAGGGRGGLTVPAGCRPPPLTPCGSQKVMHTRKRHSELYHELNQKFHTFDRYRSQSTAKVRAPPEFFLPKAQGPTRHRAPQGRTLTRGPRCRGRSGGVCPRVGQPNGACLA